MRCTSPPRRSLEAWRPLDAGRSIAERRRQLLYDDFPRRGRTLEFEYTDLEVEVEGTVDKTQAGYCFTGNRDPSQTR